MTVVEHTMRHILAVALAILTPLASANAQVAKAEPGRVTYATDTSTDTPNQPIQLAGDDHVLVLSDGAARVYDARTLALVKTHTSPAGVEHLPYSTRLNDTMLLLRDAAGDRLAHPVTGAVELIIPKGEDVAALQSSGKARTVVTHNGTFVASSGTPEPHSLFIRNRNDTPIATIDLGPDRSNAATPAAAVSPDGARVTVFHDKQLIVVDAASGRKTAFKPDIGTAKVTALTFTSSDRIILLTETGPLFDVAVDNGSIVRRIDAPDVPRRYAITSFSGGSVLQIEGRRQSAVMDTATGKHVRAARGSSGSGYMLFYNAPDLVLRGGKARQSKAASYGLYQRINGDFKELYRKELDGLQLGTIALSPNGACLFLATPKRSVVLDAKSQRELLVVSGLKSKLDSTRFTRGGQSVVALDDMHRLVSIVTPTACHGVGKA